MRSKQSIVMLGVGAVVIVGAFLLSNFQGRDESRDVQTNKTVDSEIAPQYIEYSETNLVKAQEKGRVVLYFWASWCPTCKVLDKELRERGSELPNDVTILKTNYDTEKELKKKYQIVQQHTLVQVDRNGNEVTKWIGGNIDVIKEQLK